MTTAITVRAAALAPDVRRWVAPAAILAGLAGVVALRWWATRAGLDPLAVGAAFGLLLLGLVLAADRPAAARRLPGPGSVAIGTLAGLGLVALTLAGAAIAGSTLVPGLARPAAPFAPWALVIVLVAVAEEAVLRGVLFDRVASASGLAAALAVTTLAFALLHVPLYGWSVVPLDLAVGLLLGGLRIATRGIAAPAAAHAVADLATWWL